MKSDHKPAEPLKILVIEDDPIAARLYGTYLKKAGYGVIVANDGPSGVHQAIELRPDGVLLDIMLPGLNGEEVLKEIRTRMPGLPVVVYTNGFVPLLIDKMLAGGATTVFNKISLTGQELAHAFDKALRGKEAA